MPSIDRITGHTRVVGLIGHPVRHSLSPVIHNAGFRSTGVDFTYVAFDVAPGAAASALEAARVLDLAGLSVTMPHKSDVARAVDDLGESASRLDSVNTVEFLPGGRLIGHSTDGDGLVSSLSHRDVEVRDRSVVVFGAGAAARSVIDALARHGARSIVVVNRTLESARRAVHLAHGRGETCEVSDEVSVAGRIASADIVVNATSVGMGSPSAGEILTSDLPFDPAALVPGKIVVDLVYHPIETPLLRLARSKGCQAIDGLGMLVHQAALQQIIWTSHSPDVEEMTEAALLALS